jgi:hypothetical protein
LAPGVRIQILPGYFPLEEFADEVRVAAGSFGAEAVRWISRVGAVD